MFRKVIKYDFLYSYKIFFLMGLIILAFATASRVSRPDTGVNNLRTHETPTGTMVINPTTVYGPQGEIHEVITVSDAISTGGALLGMIMMGIAVVCIFHILSYFHKTMFDDTGYLTLTLPISKRTLLFSKLCVAVVWFNFMIFVAAVAVVIYDSPSMQFNFMNLSRDFSLQNFVAFIEVNVLAVTLILLLFFLSVFSRS